VIEFANKLDEHGLSDGKHCVSNDAQYQTSLLVLQGIAQEFGHHKHETRPQKLVFESLVLLHNHTYIVAVEYGSHKTDGVRYYDISAIVFVEVYLEDAKLQNHVDSTVEKERQCDSQLIWINEQKLEVLPHLFVKRVILVTVYIERGVFEFDHDVEHRQKQNGDVDTLELVEVEA